MIKPWDKFTLEWAFETYDQNFSMGGNAYHISAEMASRLNGGPADGSVIIDVGAGTGMSTEVLAKVNPNFGLLIAAEPSAGIHVARHKFSHAELVTSDNPNEVKDETGLSLSKEYLRRLNTTRQELSQMKDKVRFLKVPAQELSAHLDSKVDSAYCFSSFHWFAEDPDSGSIKAENALVALGQLENIVRPGGTLVFNESGLQFDFGTEQYQGSDSAYSSKDLNGLHNLQQEFHKRFVEEFNTVLLERGFPKEATIDPKNKVDPYHHIFNLGTLDNLLENSGFKRVAVNPENLYNPSQYDIPVESYVPSHRGYAVTILPKKPKSWEQFIVGGGNMRYFNLHPALRELPVSDRKNILEAAYQKTVEKHGPLAEAPFAETFATFVAVRK